MQQSAYKKYLLGVLTVIAVSSFMERTALGLVLDDIKAEFLLSDTQLGLLGGFAFAFFYSVMGVPLGRWADRGNRVAIIALTAALWSATVTLCAAAGSFLQLLAIRVGVAVGEAGCTPPAFSLIADTFSRAERPHANAIYGIAAPLSTVIGFFFVGWLNELYGWRITFIVLGLPGLALAAVAWLTLKEPRQTTSQRMVQLTSASQPSLKEVVKILWANNTFGRLLVGMSISVFFVNGIFLWLPAFVMRSYDLTTAQAGMWLAGIWGVCGMAGAYLGGTLASRYAPDNESLQLKILGVLTAVAGTLSAFAYTGVSLYAAFALIGISTFGLAAANGPVFAAIQTLVPERMRAVSIALVYLVVNLIGWGFGPLAAGALSDAFQVWVGDQSLRYALLTLSPGYLLTGWFFWHASKTVTQDLAAVQSENSPAVESLSLTEESPYAGRL